MAPAQQGLVCGHQSRSVLNRSCGNKAIGWITMKFQSNREERNRAGDWQFFDARIEQTSPEEVCGRRQG
jgi:hypothetical protein